jgi:hypothetical protein
MIRRELVACKRFLLIDEALARTLHTHGAVTCAKLLGRDNGFEMLAPQLEVKHARSLTAPGVNARLDFPILPIQQSGSRNLQKVYCLVGSKV